MSFLSAPTPAWTALRRCYGMEYRCPSELREEVIFHICEINRGDSAFSAKNRYLPPTLSTTFCTTKIEHFLVEVGQQIERFANNR